jgi:hypothetical protein
MSDTSQGPSWWRASDGKWYPPEALRKYRPPPPAPAPEPLFVSVPPPSAPPTPTPNRSGEIYSPTPPRAVQARAATQFPPLTVVVSLVTNLLALGVLVIGLLAILARAGVLDGIPSHLFWWSIGGAVVLVLMRAAAKAEFPRQG